MFISFLHSLFLFYSAPLSVQTEIWCIVKIISTFIRAMWCHWSRLLARQQIKVLTYEIAQLHETLKISMSTFSNSRISKFYPQKSHQTPLKCKTFSSYPTNTMGLPYAKKQGLGLGAPVVAAHINYHWHSKYGLWQEILPNKRQWDFLFDVMNFSGWFLNTRK